MASRILSLQGRLELWAEHAHDVLTETAQVMHLAITDADLARIVQERAGVTSEMPARSWLPKVLRIVADRAHDAGEPPLTALVVRSTDHKVGPDYDAVIAQEGLDGDREHLAALGRLDCYRRYAHGVPEDAAPNLSPITSLASDTRGTTRTARSSSRSARVASAPKERAARPPKPAKVVVVEKEPEICTSCFLQLPLSGICPNC